MEDFYISNDEESLARSPIEVISSCLLFYKNLLRDVMDEAISKRWTRADILKRKEFYKYKIQEYYQARSTLIGATCDLD